jgi:hypothetical protein
MLSICKKSGIGCIRELMYSSPPKPLKEVIFVISGFLASYTYIVMDIEGCFDLQVIKCLGLFR